MGGKGGGEMEAEEGERGRGEGGRGEGGRGEGQGEGHSHVLGLM